MSPEPLNFILKVSTISPPGERGLENEVIVPFVNAIEPEVPKSNLKE
jgi:hypothetical protein